MLPEQSIIGKKNLSELKAASAALALEGAGGLQGAAGEEGLSRHRHAGWELGSACSCTAAPAQPQALPAAPTEAVCKTPESMQAVNCAAERNK